LNIKSIKVYDIFGKNIYANTNMSSNMIIDFSKYETGIYIIELEDIYKNYRRQKFIKH